MPGTPHKRLVVCCDGTWQDLDGTPTNVVRFATAVAPRGDDGVAQVVYYDPGVGARANPLKGGAMGDGINENIREAYRFLALNYEPGDEIYLVGYSRGAYTVRSLAGLIRTASIVRREHVCKISRAFELYRERDTGPDDHDAIEFRRTNGYVKKKPALVPIKALACWDTVGSLGVPDFLPGPIDELLNRRHQFHDNKVSYIVEHAFHAAAVDEIRKSFQLTPMERTKTTIRLANQQTAKKKAKKKTKASAGEGSEIPRAKLVEELWFPGDHGGVGGGSIQKARLADVALGWMIERLTSTTDLTLKPDLMRGGLSADIMTPFEPEFGILGHATGRAHRDIPSFHLLHESVRERWCRSRTDGRDHKEIYFPKALGPFEGELDAYCED